MPAGSTTSIGWYTEPATTESRFSRPDTTTNATVAANEPDNEPSAPA